MQAADYMIAESGIRLAQARYADAVFRKDFKAFGNCLTDDSEWRIGAELLRGRAECVAFLQDRLAPLRWVLMTFRTPILQANEATAAGRTYVTEQTSFPDGRNNLSLATYYERFVLQEGLWRRSWALFQLHYLGPADLSGRFFDATDYGPPPAMPPADAPSAGSVR